MTLMDREFHDVCCATVAPGPLTTPSRPSPDFPRSTNSNCTILLGESRFSFDALVWVPKSGQDPGSDHETHVIVRGLKRDPCIETRHEFSNDIRESFAKLCSHLLGRATGRLPILTLVRACDRATRRSDKRS
jgi:hypothetical protein